MKIPIPDYEGFYEIDRLGNVYSVKSGKPIKPIKNSTTGYMVVNLSKKGKIKQHRLHILVAKTFIPNPDNKPTVNHIYGDKSLNSVDDLEWATHQEQMDHAKSLRLTASGERNGGCKLTDFDVLSAFKRCMAGEELKEVAKDLGVSRNTLPKRFKLLGFEEQWANEVYNRKQRAALKRHYGE